MKSRFSLRWTWLRLAAVLLLPLHAGFAQASMVMSAHAPATSAAPGLAAADAAPMPDGMPCHHAAKAPAGKTAPTPHKGGCCDAGSCHCAAACGLPVITMRVSALPGITHSPFASHSLPAAAAPPDLRPPIG